MIDDAQKMREIIYLNQSHLDSLNSHSFIGYGAMTIFRPAMTVSTKSPA